MNYVNARVLLWFTVLLVIPATAGWIWHTSGDWGTWLLTVTVLCIAAWHLDASLLTPPDIWISRPDELGHTDLIFFLYEHEGFQVPRDYLLQLHALLGNMGGKQTVITSIKITAFKTSDGETVNLPDLSAEIGGHMYSTWTSWREMGSSFDRRIDPPPFVLAPNDILIVRFRGRRGIDWGTRWTLDRLRAHHTALAAAPAEAIIEVIYRWGRHKKVVTKGIPIEVAQHEQYVNQLRILTSNFTTLPNFPERPIMIE